MEDKITTPIESPREIKSTLHNFLKEDIPDMKQAATILDATTDKQISAMKEWVSYLRQQEAHLAEAKQKATDEVSAEQSQHKTEMRQQKIKSTDFGTWPWMRYLIRRAIATPPESARDRKERERRRSHCR